MPVLDAPAVRRRSLLPVFIVAVMFPIVFFYAYLLYMSRNIPVLDDYDAGLNFANHLMQLPDFSQRLNYFVSAQHNEYKIFLGHGLVWLQLALTGQVNFAVLSALGNSAVLVLGIVLWKMFLPGVELERRLALFLPVPFLLFQYQYVETLNWPLPGVQNLPVVACAIGSIYLLGRGTRGSFAAVLAVMALGIASSGNGFIIVPVGMLMLLIERRYARLGTWTLTAGLCAWAYAYHYNGRATHGPGQPLSTVLLHPHFAYLLGFLGAAGRYPSKTGAVAVGFALCAFFGWVIGRGYLRRNPVVGYCLLFILLTGIGVSGLRADLGLEQSVSSRYRMYSDLLLVFAWFAFVKMSRLDDVPSLRRSRSFVIILTLSVLFSIAMDGIGVRNLRRRDQSLTHGMALFVESGGMRSPIYSTDGKVQGYVGFDEHARQVLIESEKAGTYTPRDY